MAPVVAPRLLRWTALALCLAVVATRPALLPALLPFLVLIALTIWLASKAGLGHLAVAALFAVGRRGRTRSRPVLRFRVTGGDERPIDVRLIGHDDGVALGDSVTITGPRVAGRIHAFWMRNETTGVLLVRSGLAGAALTAVAAGLLVSVLIGVG